MSERTQYQYTPLVGPVLVPAVVDNPERLAWLPRGQPPARTLAPNRLGAFVQPSFEALYRPAGLEWGPSDRYAGRALPRASFDAFVFLRPIVAAAYDPQTLEWIPRGSNPRVPLELRRVGDFQRPRFEALYRPEGLQWLLTGRYPQRILPAIYQGAWVCDPTTPAAAVPTPPPAVMFTPPARATFTPGRLDA